MHIAANDLTLEIDGKSILRDVTVDVPSGTSMALVGHSGSGKTTLLNCLGLLLPLTSGRLVYDGNDVTGSAGSERSRFWRKHVAFIFQDYGLVEDESVGFNVHIASAPLFRRRTRNPAVLQALETVGLGGRQDDPVTHLSGGERQRVSIARAIFKQATLILADEPTASLDDDNRQLVQDLLLQETNRGATVIAATHDLKLASACNNHLRLDASGMKAAQDFVDN